MDTEQFRFIMEYPGRPSIIEASCMYEAAMWMTFGYNVHIYRWNDTLITWVYIETCSGDTSLSLVQGEQA